MGVLAPVMVLACSLVLSRVMVLACIIIYGVSLCHSVSPCYGVSPCNVTFEWVTRPEHSKGKKNEVKSPKRPPARNQVPEGPLNFCYILQISRQVLLSIILQNTYKHPQKQLIVRLAQIFLTFVLYILVATSKCSFSETWIY